MQLLLIAFAFGAFFEGSAGFGTPVAVAGAILIGLGFSPLAASGLSLIANTAPVAFGEGLEAGWARAVVPVAGVGDDVTIRGLADVDLLRVTAFEPLPDVTLPVDKGPVRFDPAELCLTP